MITPDFDKAKRALIEKLQTLDINALDLSDYSKNYLTFLIDDVWETLSRFEQVIEQALHNSPKLIGQITIVDFGGGTGLQSLLAVELGFKSVIYNDIFEGSCHDVAVLATACSLKLEDIFLGDTSDLVLQLNQNSIKADLIVSYDVIEHVYDVNENFRAFSQLEHKPDVIVYGSGANIRNPFYTRVVKKDHIAVENLDREQVFGHKKSDSLKSYLSLRKEIISSSAPHLGEMEIDKLAENTRGLIKTDIEKQINDYILTGKFGYRPSHPTNTCDPMTGNWCENLLDFEWLKSTAQNLGFDANISKGVYSPNGFTRRNLLRWMFNVANNSLGSLGFAFSPFYLLILKPSTRNL